MYYKSIRIQTAVVVAFYLLFSLSSLCAQPLKDWTFMVFMAADNNLEAGAEKDMMQLETIGSSDKVNFLVQIDRGGDYSNNTFFKWTGAKRYYITKSTDPNKVTSAAVEELGDVDMASPETLLDFVVWAKEKYPAKRYALILWNHGSGWKDVKPSNLFGHSMIPSGLQIAMDTISYNIAYDDTSNSSMDIPTLGAVMIDIKNTLGKKIDLLGYDACLMQMFEVAFAAKDLALYQVASPDLEPENGWPYHMIAKELVDKPDMPPDALGNIIVSSYKESYSGGSQGNTAVILSQINLQKLDEFQKSLDSFCNAIVNNLQDIDVIETARNNALKYSYGDYLDLGHFLSLLKKSKVSSATTSAATSLLTAITGTANKKGIIESLDYNGDKFAATTGLSIFFPNREGFRIYEFPYGELPFAQKTAWLKMLKELSAPSIPYLRLEDIVLEDKNKDGRIAPGEEVRVYLSVKNIGKTSPKEATLLCSTDSKHLNSSTFSAKLTNLPKPDKTSLIKAFDFKVNPTAPLHTEIKLSCTVSGPGIPNSTLVTTFYIRKAFSTSGHALLVLTDSQSQTSKILQEMLVDSNVVFDLWDRDSDGEIRTEVLKRYLDGWVIVSTQDSTPGQSINEEEVEALDEFLAMGGRLTLTGQDIGFSLRDSDFLQTRCRASFIQDDINIHVVKAINGFANEQTFNIFGGNGANNQKWPDEIDALSGAQLIIKYNEGARDLADVRTMSGPNHKPKSLTRGIKSSGGAAIRVVDGYRLLLFGFGIEAICNRPQRTELMQTIVAQMQPNPASEIRNYALAAIKRSAHRSPSEKEILENSILMSNLNRRLLQELSELEEDKPGTIQKALNFIKQLPDDQRRAAKSLERGIKSLLDFSAQHDNPRN